jgi:hypothetical protein
MNSAPLPTTDCDGETAPELAELARCIADLPTASRECLEPAFDRVLARARQRRRVLALVQESLSQLRLDVKYLMFDLDVTKRERDECRRSLGDR